MTTIIFVILIAFSFALINEIIKFRKSLSKAKLKSFIDSIYIEVFIVFPNYKYPEVYIFPLLVTLTFYFQTYEQIKVDDGRYLLAGLSVICVMLFLLAYLLIKNIESSMRYHIYDKSSSDGVLIIFNYAVIFIAISKIISETTTISHLEAYILLFYITICYLLLIRNMLKYLFSENKNDNSLEFNLKLILTWFIMIYGQFLSYMIIYQNSLNQSYGDLITISSEYSSFNNSLIDYLYFISITSFTIGYGDLIPLGTHGRILSILITFTGFFIATIFITTILSSTKNKI